VRLFGCSGAIRESALRENLLYGEYDNPPGVPGVAPPPSDEVRERGATTGKGDPGIELTFIIKSAKGIDLRGAIVYWAASEDVTGFGVLSMLFFFFGLLGSSTALFSA
jgi:hypothetical protein